ncbi:hypothetical protein [Streptomyces yangpuensis]|uniref:hypothetical protein n=1 Tax=Streptomyces yangpuensis TaxID=1648182 RepID=UPI0012FEC54C|nr:hypothetical protein [Streptomyces yangpuensis]
MQVAAQITFDAEQQPFSRQLHLRALELASGERELGPAEVEPIVLAVLSMQEEHLGRPASSLRIAGSVPARADLPGRVAAIFPVRAGRALARLVQGPRADGPCAPPVNSSRRVVKIMRPNLRGGDAGCVLWVWEGNCSGHTFHTSPHRSHNLRLKG